jgi:hypothetical protein
MDFWIVAIDHALQLTKDANDSDKIRAQKDRLEALLRSRDSQNARKGSSRKNPSSVKQPLRLKSRVTDRDLFPGRFKLTSG